MLIPLVFAFLAGFSLLLGLIPPSKGSSRARLQMDALGIEEKKEKKGPFDAIRSIALITSPLVSKQMRQKLAYDLGFGQTRLRPEEFVFVQILIIVALLFFIVPAAPPEMKPIVILLCFVGGYVFPKMWLATRIKKIKSDIVKELPDAVDLLGLCVNAGLDFMMGLKWVVEKSRQTVVISEFNNLLQEISVGKPRREALRDLAKKYELPDLSTFARTMIQADRMGTSVSEALNILSEDMRLSRYRRGEAIALVAPLKMLIPLLFCIFPVVAILVGGPIFLDFMMNNPLKNLGA